MYLQAATGLVPLPPARDPIAVQSSGWDSLTRQVETFARQRDARFVAVSGYALGSELAWHLPPDRPVLGIDPHWTTTTLPRARPGGTWGLLVQDIRQPIPKLPDQWAHADRIGEADRPGIPAGRYAIYRVLAEPARDAAVILPHR